MDEVDQQRNELWMCDEITTITIEAYTYTQNSSNFDSVKREKKNRTNESQTKIAK